MKTLLARIMVPLLTLLISALFMNGYSRKSGGIKTGRMMNEKERMMFY